MHLWMRMLSSRSSFRKANNPTWAGSAPTISAPWGSLSFWGHFSLLLFTHKDEHWCSGFDTFSGCPSVSWMEKHWTWEPHTALRILHEAVRRATTAKWKPVTVLLGHVLRQVSKSSPGDWALTQVSQLRESTWIMGTSWNRFLMPAYLLLSLRTPAPKSSCFLLSKLSLNLPLSSMRLEPFSLLPNFPLNSRYRGEPC